MSIVCEEVFDENTTPSVEEIRDYATKIGIDPDSEPQLLPLAAEGLMKALPPGWKPCFDEKSKSYYYYNNLTGKTQWEHPLDDVYRGLVKKARTESQSLSIGEHTEDATYARDDLLSYDEPPLKNLEASNVGTKKKLLPIKSPDDLDKKVPPKLMKQKSEDQSGLVKKRLNIFSSFDSDKKELTVTGGGAMFLKSNTKKLTDVSPIKTPDAQPRSILRERNLIEPSKSMEFDRSMEKSDKDDEDKKSVRFNLESNTDVAITFSDKSSSEEEFQERKGEVKSRFTVSPVKDILLTPIENKNLKLIKPNPGDFIKPKLTVSANSDSEDDSKSAGNKVENEKGKADREFERVRQAIWDEKNEELESFKDDMNESHQKEMERLLIEEKTRHEENIKVELEKLRLEMENRARGTLQEERELLEEKLEKEKEKLGKEFEKRKMEFEQTLMEKFEAEQKEFEKNMKQKFLKTEKDIIENFENGRKNLITSQNAILEQLRENHSIIMEELKKEFMQEEQALRKEHQAQMAEIRSKITSNLENEKQRFDEKLYEKLKCEKKLLEEKYRCLKDKYLRLKTDVKLSIEKRNKRREQSGTTTTGSETERSHSINKERSPLHSPSTNRRNAEKPPTPKHGRSKFDHKTARQLIIQDLDTSASDRSFKTDDHVVRNDNDSSEGNAAPGRSRKKLFSRLKSSSTSRINNNSKSRKSQRLCSPVENLRRQLQKLEDLEDQIPQNPQPDTYHLRYPFDSQKFEGSSELEFFRHRIHLERDSIKRAKESLRNQKSIFQQRQKELKLKHGSMARHTLQQLCQEEKELTDMEVSLHRTRSLLGEKVIRLRHLEQSLQRATLNADQNRTDDATLSDLSSHSASSGISSTEFATAEVLGAKGIVRGEHLQESSEIIQSLENLNSEIREIWEVLYKQQQQSGNMTAVMPLVYPDLGLGWPILAGTAAAVPAPPSIPTLADRLHNYRQHVALANAQSTMVTHANQGATTTLVERTRSLRHWLGQAGVEGGAREGNTPQATL